MQQYTHIKSEALNMIFYNDNYACTLMATLFILPSEQISLSC